MAKYYHYNDKEGYSHGPVSAEELARLVKEGNVDVLTIRSPNRNEPGGSSAPSLELHLIPAVANLFCPGFGLLLQRRYAAGVLFLVGVFLGAAVVLVSWIALPELRGISMWLIIGAFPWNFMLCICSTVSIMEYEI